MDQLDIFVDGVPDLATDHILVGLRTSLVHAADEDDDSIRQIHQIHQSLFSFCFIGHFPGEPGLAVFIGAKDGGGGDDN